MALFGTDGVRGIAKTELTSKLIFNLSVSAAKVLSKSKNPKAIIGNDSRESAAYLEAAVIAGLEKHGVEIHLAGTIPTPAIAYLVKSRGYDFGVMISASHNPMPDNGIKFFAAGGEKLTDQIEQQIESNMQSGSFSEADIQSINRQRYLDNNAADEYLRFLDNIFGKILSGLKVVVDCANGAASIVAPAAYEQAGANVIAISNKPDGQNINQGCGSTHLDNLISAVKSNSADLGIAHDGDADRCLLIDSDGAVVDGDQVLAILAIALKRANKLNKNTVVTTVMSNQGFFNAMKSNQINIAKTAVGDRYVLEQMQQEKYSLGGEQSGHIVVSEFATTGDGILTALLVMRQMVENKTSLSKLASVITKYPQVLVNVKNVDKSKLSSNSRIADVVSRQADLIKTDGQILVRSSGTENLVRIMVEAKTLQMAKKIADEISEVVKSEIGG